MNNEHKISTFEDILDLIKGAYPDPELFEGKKNHEIMAGGFTWIDDKKHDLKSIKITFPEFSFEGLPKSKP